jgi:hypothetical protein
LIFFFQFLQAGGRWEEFLRHCPLHYTGNRGSGDFNLAFQLAAELGAPLTDGTAIIRQLDYTDTAADTGKWLDWLSPPGTPGGEAATRRLMREWTRNDYKAAGEWLAAATPPRDTAVMSYLETVAPYDPEVAARWAGTLTGGRAADAMKRIHAALQAADSGAASDFARRHGLTDE